MSRLLGNAAIRWTDAGESSTTREHPLRGPLSRIRPAYSYPELFTGWSADGSAVEVISVGSGVSEAIVTIRQDENRDSLIEMLRAGARGLTLTYYPDLDDPGVSLALELLSPGPDAVAAFDEEPLALQEATIDLRLRRTDGSEFPAWFFQQVYAGSGLQFKYLPGFSLQDATFSRTGTAAYYSHDGTLSSAATGILRDAHYVLDNAGKLVRTVKLEDAGTNLVTNPEDFSLWTDIGTVLKTAGQPDPRGGTAAYEIRDDSATALEGIFENVSFTGDAQKAIAIFVAGGSELAAGGSQIKLRDTTALADRLDINITWPNGINADPTVTATVGSVLDVSRRLKNGFYRIECQTTSVTAANTNRIEIYPAEVTAETGRLIVYGVMAENAIFPSSYTTSTRNADSLSFTYPFKPQAMTLYLKFVEAGTITGKLFAGILGSTDGSIPYFRFGDEFANGDLRVTHANETSSVGSNWTSGASIGDVVEATMQLYPDGAVQIHGSLNGGSIVSGTKSAALSFAPAWLTQTIRPNDAGSGSAIGYADFIVPPLVAAGVRTMAEMRKLT